MGALSCGFAMIVCMRIGGLCDQILYVVVHTRADDDSSPREYGTESA